MATTLSAAETREIADNLLKALTTAAGKGGSSVDVRQNRGSNSNATNRSITRANGQMDNLTGRLSNLSNTVDKVTETSKRLSRIQEIAERQHRNSNIRVASLVAGLVSDVEQQAINLGTQAKISNALQAESKKAISETSEFGRIIAGRQLENATDFKNISGVLNRVTAGLVHSNKSIKAYDAEIKRLENEMTVARSSNMNDLAAQFAQVDSIHEEMIKTTEKLNNELLRHGVATGMATDSIGFMSLGDLQAFHQRIESTNMVSSTTNELNARITEQIEQTNNWNKGVLAAVTNIHKADKGLKALAKSAMEQATMQKLGLRPEEIAEMQKSNMNIFGMTGKSFLILFGRGVIKAAGAAWDETKEIARAAFETGTKPFESVALSMRMTASDLQRATALYKQSAIGGKGGIGETHAVLNEFKDGFHQLTGDPKLAAELNLRTQNFTKSYLGGSQTVRDGTSQWEKHLKSMSVLTGKSGAELIGLVEGQMETGEMQDVMLSLRGKEQAAMVATLRARQEEFTRMGMTAEKATELAAAMAKVRAESVPDRMKQGGKLAQLAMRMGMNPQDAMKLRMMHATGDVDNPEYLRITKQLGVLVKSGREKARASSMGGAVQDEHMIQQLTMGLTGAAAAIVNGVAQAAETEGAKGVERELLQKTIADTYNDASVRTGNAAIVFEQTINALKGNVIGFMQDPGAAIAAAMSITTAVKGSNDLPGGVGSIAGSVLGSPGAMIGGGALGLYGLSKFLPGMIGGGAGAAGGTGGAGAAGGGIFKKLLGKIGGRALATMAGRGLGGLAGTLVGPVGTLAVGAAGGYFAEQLFDKFLGEKDGNPGTGGQQVMTNAATPSIQHQSVKSNADAFMVAQELQNAQLVKLNEQMKLVGTLISTGNTAAMKTSDSTTKLMEAYYTIEMEKNASNRVLQTKIAGNYLGQFGSRNGWIT